MSKYTGRFGTRLSMLGKFQFAGIPAVAGVQVPGQGASWILRRMGVRWQQDPSPTTWIQRRASRLTNV